MGQIFLLVYFLNRDMKFQKENSFLKLYLCLHLNYVYIILFFLYTFI